MSLLHKGSVQSHPGERPAFRAGESRQGPGGQGRGQATLQHVGGGIVGHVRKVGPGDYRAGWGMTVEAIKRVELMAV